jgi:hypothetical protein
MVYYDTCGIYFQSCKTLSDRVTAIDNIIGALIASQADAIAGTLNNKEYQLNDGQTIIRQVLRGPQEIAHAIAFWERTQQMYINRMNGRVSRLVDVKTFNSPRGNTR